MGSARTGEKMIMRTRLIIAAGVILAATARGETGGDPLPEAVALFTSAYAGWDGDGFRRAAENLEEAVRRQPGSFLPRYWLGAARFHQALCLRDDPASEEATERALDGAEEALEKALELDGSCGECFALLSVITGIRIGRNPLSGIWRGSRFKKQAEAALRLSPENPRVHYLVGTNYYHGPQRADSRDRARDHFLRAESLYEKELRTPADDLEPRWGYDSTLAFLGDILREAGDREKAREYYNRTLAVNPGNGRARQGLEEMEIKEENDE